MAVLNSYRPTTSVLGIIKARDQRSLHMPLRECSSSDWYAFPEDHRSPHDSWVKSITISEPSSGERQEKRGLEIHIQLLAAYHDGIIELTYKRVLRYSLEGMRDVAGHGDWLEDEVNVKKHDSLLHRIMLTNGTFEIEAEDVEYKWTPQCERFPTTKEPWGQEQLLNESTHAQEDA